MAAILKPNPSAAHGDSSGSGYSPLIYAARAGHKDVCQLLIEEYGADVNAVTKGGASALHRAATGGYSNVVQLLIEKGADGMIQDSDLETPAHKAAVAGHRSIASYLIMIFPAAASVAR